VSAAPKERRPRPARDRRGPERDRDRKDRLDRGATPAPPAPPAAVYAFGRRAVAEALAAGTATRVLIGRRSGLEDLARRAAEAGVEVEETDTARLDGLAGGLHHQGVAARVRLPRPLGERDLAERAWAPDALVVVLDGVEDPQNVGAAARAAECAGAEALVLRERRAAGVTPAAIRASAGALLHLPVGVVANVPRALGRLRDAGFTAVGLDGDAPKTVYTAEPVEGRLALVVGAEGEGLSRLVRETCDLLVSLPMLGKVGSLNASAATAAALYGFVLPARIARGPAALP
jgi:23S rRNA (guanosine2251-2'-O)-methyltransferase